MEITCIDTINEGYVHCRSNFYSAFDILSSGAGYHFSVGINKLIGEIDSGVWAISYLLSMYKYRKKDFVLFNQPVVAVNKDPISLNDLSQYTCYMDELYSLFSKKAPSRISF